MHRLFLTSGTALSARSIFAAQARHGLAMNRGMPAFEVFTEAEYKAAIVGLKKATDDVKKVGETAETEMKKLGTLTGETKTVADQALLKMNELSARLDTMEQKAARRGGGGSGGDEHKTLGQRCVESDEIKAVISKGASFKGRVDLEVKNITSASVSGTSSSTALVVADRVPGIVQVQPNRPTVIRDLLMPGSTNSGSVDYVRETVFTNAAAPVAENPANPKPQSDLAFDLKNLPIRTIAHFVLASKQILADAPMLQSYIDGRLRYGLAYAEDLQFLMGDGTGTNLLGMMPQATAYAAPAGINVAVPTAIDRLRLAMLQATLALYPATGSILNPIDWAGIELTKDSQGRYIFANPVGLAGPTLWGLPIAESLAMPQNNFLTGAFKYACQIFDREDANVSISTEDVDNFRKNMVTILAEERTALAVYRPQALIKGAFTP